MRIAILEDRDSDAQFLTNLLERYERESGISFSLSRYMTTDALLRACAESAFDLVFLDIYLCGNTSGMAAARQLQANYPQCRLIFATSSHAYAVESYAVRAAYYLTKPLSYDRLCDAMEIACSHICRDNLCIHLNVEGIPAPIPLRDVTYADSLARKARVHLADSCLSVDEPMSEVLRLLLAHEQFLLCNRNLAVNMDWIAETRDSTFLLKNRCSVPIRQRGRREVRQAYLAYRMSQLGEGGIL